MEPSDCQYECEGRGGSLTAAAQAFADGGEIADGGSGGRGGGSGGGGGSGERMALGGE